MYIPKKYGLSKIDVCPFCSKTSVVKNSQGIPVCQKHAKSKLDEMKCVCGSWLELCAGKWGPYFRCLNCGNINFKKALEVNPQIRLGESKNQEVKKENKTGVKETKKEVRKEITITSDDVEFFG